MAGDKRENWRESWLVRYNVGYKILAVCLAFLLWYFVAGQRDPLAKQTYARPVELRPTTTQLVSTLTLPEVTITISGTKDLVQSLQDQDIHAYVDVSGQTAGVCYLPIQTSVPDNIQVLSIYPQTVRVSLDYQGSKKLPVKVVLQGTPAPGFMTLSPEVTPDVVTVSGPSGLLAGLQDVQAVVDTTGVNTNITAKVSLQVPGSGDKLALNPPEAAVVIPVVSSGLVKNVPVIADVTGTPGVAQSVKSVAVDPTMVALTGSQDVLSSLVSVYTQPVDISGATGQVVEDVDLVLPQGVSMVTQGQVHVTVVLGAAATGAPQPSQQQQQPQPQLTQ
jgi:YbbR domain-containing protein